jgi:hypothetical protein
VDIAISTCLAVCDDEPSSLHDVKEFKMFLFLAIVTQMEHDIHNILKDSWLMMEHFSVTLYDKRRQEKWA